MLHLSANFDIRLASPVQTENGKKHISAKVRSKLIAYCLLGSRKELGNNFSEGEASERRVCSNSFGIGGIYEWDLIYDDHEQAWRICRQELTLSHTYV